MFVGPLFWLGMHILRNSRWLSGPRAPTWPRKELAMSAPTLRIQLTRTESLLVYPGMALISAIHKLWRETSELPMAHPDLRTGGCPRGQYEPAFGELTVKLESTFAQSRFHRSRLRLTVFELALCALAVRVTNTRVKHGHLMRWRRNHDLATGRLRLGIPPKTAPCR